MMVRQWRVTPGEIARRLDGFEDRMQSSLKAIDDRLANNLVARSEYLARNESLNQRVDDLDSFRAVIAGRIWTLFVAVTVALIGAGGAIAAALLH